MEISRKTYHVERRAGGVTCRVEIEGDHGRASYPLRHVIVHSPTGFEFGYGGSGPSDLALSILLDHLGEIAGVPETNDQRQISAYLAHTKARHLYQPFKWLFIAPQKTSSFQITSHQIDAWLRRDTEAEELEQVLTLHQQHIEQRLARLKGRRR